MWRTHIRTSGVTALIVLAILLYVQPPFIMATDSEGVMRVSLPEVTKYIIMSLVLKSIFPLVLSMSGSCAA